VNPIAAKRKELGLTQQQVARLLGTKQSNVSAYEKGVLTPGSVVEQRLAALLALEIDSQFRKFEVSTIASSAVELKDFLVKSGVHPSGLQPPQSEVDRMLWETDLIRFMIELSDQFVRLTTPSDQILFMSEPATTGNPDIDALYAGIAVHLTRNGQLERVPPWTSTRMRAGRPAWFPGLPARKSILHQEAIVNGIPALRARGIYVSRKNLESV
jgi:transcriptional regulator with XRE-family HTH domain